MSLDCVRSLELVGFIDSLSKRAMKARHQVVQESPRGVLSYPDALPKERGTLATKFNACLAAMAFLGASLLVYAGSEKLTVLESLSLSGVAFAHCVSLTGVFSAVVRVGPFLEDLLHHLASRHEGNVWTLARRAFAAPTSAYIALATALLVSWHGLALRHDTVGLLPWVLLLGAAGLVASILGMLSSPLSLSLSLSRLGGLDYGSGMAESFFYGYLRLVLPVTGDANKGVRERVDDFIAAEGLADKNFPVRKLFILIPASTYISCTLDELAQGWMEPAKSLAEQQFNVAGVVGRSYKSQVYKIRDPAATHAPYVYVVAEGATPLKTLNDVSATHPGYCEHRKELIHRFFTTLHRKLREDDKTRGTCELLYYVDKDEHGDSVNVGKLILQRIKEIQEMQELKAMDLGS